MKLSDRFFIVIMMVSLATGIGATIYVVSRGVYSFFYPQKPTTVIQNNHQRTQTPCVTSLENEGYLVISPDEQDDYYKD